MVNDEQLRFLFSLASGVLDLIHRRMNGADVSGDLVLLQEKVKKSLAKEKAIASGNNP